MDNTRSENLDELERGEAGTNGAAHQDEERASGQMAGPPSSGMGSMNVRNPALERLGIFDETMDPTHPDFDFEKWAQTITDMRARLGVPTPARSGFVVKSLTVRGRGPADKAQDTVWKALSSPFNARKLFRRKQAKTILHGIDGYVEKGELLLVLGRPGSGCSTFLKTITGRMDGLELDRLSVVSYNGMFALFRCQTRKPSELSR